MSIFSQEGRESPELQEFKFNNDDIGKQHPFPVFFLKRKDLVE